MSAETELEELSEAVISGYEAALAESQAIDRAWLSGKLDEWLTANLEAERKAFYGDASG
jgi:hypothetical protein